MIGIGTVFQQSFYQRINRCKPLFFGLSLISSLVAILAELVFPASPIVFADDGAGAHHSYSNLIFVLWV